MHASETNEKRRQFTEAVVEGVSAGIVGLDAFGAITLVNARACDMLGRDEIALMASVSVTSFRRSARFSSAPSIAPGPGARQIELGSGPDYRTYQVQLTREGTVAESKGLCLHARRYHRPAVGAAYRRLGRCRPPHRPRDQESADPDPALGRAPPAPLCRQARRRFRHLRQVHQHHHPAGRRHRPHGRRILLFRSHAGSHLERADLSDTVRQAVFLESVRLPEISIGRRCRMSRSMPISTAG